MRGVEQRRGVLVERTRKLLLQRDAPRLEMGLILALTGVAAFFTSFGSLRLGLTSMMWRYPLAVMGGYVVFLCLLRVWIWAKREGGAGDIDEVDVDGGADASGVEGDVEVLDSGGEPSSGLDLLNIGGDEAFFVVILLAVVAVGAIAVGLAIYFAPVLLAELLVDGAIVAGLYRRMGVLAESVWLQSAFRRTWIPLAVLLVCAALAGLSLSLLGPRQSTAGSALRAWLADEPSAIDAR